jgi:hypothetical protein
LQPLRISSLGIPSSFNASPARTIRASSFPSLSPSLLLHDVDLARRFFLRQGLWIEGLRTPPGQECSNGSLTFFAVVLWRTFFYEIDESEDGAIFADGGEVWPAGIVYPLAKAETGSAFAISN